MIHSASHYSGVIADTQKVHFSRTPSFTQDSSFIPFNQLKPNNRNEPGTHTNQQLSGMQPFEFKEDGERRNKEQHTQNQ